MSYFTEAIDRIKAKFYTYDEFPSLDRHLLPADSLKRALAVKESDLEIYSANLKGQELEGLLLDLVSTKDDAEVQRAIKIICLRISKRILKLIAKLTQYHFRSYGIDKLRKGVSHSCDIAAFPNERFLNAFGPTDDLVNALTQILLKKNTNIQEIYAYYDIYDKSPLAYASSFMFFSRCDKTGFLLNYDYLADLIRFFQPKKAIPIVSHYLNSMTLIEYDDTINNIIAEKFGQPYTSVEWEPFSKDLRDKFAQWNYLQRLKHHCESNQKKFRILLQYLPEVRTNYEIAEINALVIDFGAFVIVDITDRPDAFLYEKNLFETEMRNWQSDQESLPTFLDKKKEPLSAREFMLSTDDAPCIKLTFEGIHYYYVEEIMDIKFGYEPDMRKHHITTR